MKDERVSSSRSKGRSWPGTIQAVSVLSVLMGLMLYIGKAVSMEIPPEVEKKAVSLKKSNADAEHFFADQCGKCHKSPDPAKQVFVKPGCSTSITKDDLARMQGYMSDVRAGKDMYESYCGRCHALIEPGSHTFEYWSKNICTSDSCLVKRRLNNNEEQQLLLYLSSHASKI